MVERGQAGESFNVSPWEDRGGVAAGTILATALAAGVIAYLIRRAREEAQARQQPINRVARLAQDLSSSDTVEMGRDFLAARVLPEFKPALLAILAEIEDVVEQAFRGAERAIKRL
jgi:hypothetical protein